MINMDSGYDRVLQKAATTLHNLRARGRKDYSEVVSTSGDEPDWAGDWSPGRKTGVSYLNWEGWQNSLKNSTRRKKRTSFKRKASKRGNEENKGRPFVIKPISSPLMKPLLVFVNPKSGGNQGTKVLQMFMWYLNPRQVFDLSQEGPRDAKGDVDSLTSRFMEFQSDMSIKSKAEVVIENTKRKLQNKDEKQKENVNLEANPEKFNSRFRNKMFYAGAAFSDFLQRSSRDLSKHVKVVCDGTDLTSKIQELKFQCIVFLNIPRYCAGTMPWGNPGDHREFEPQRHDDGYIEVIGFTMASLAALQVGGHGERLHQCREVTLLTYKSIPMQVDGEPCRLAPSLIRISLRNQANMDPYLLAYLKGCKWPS
ncbi:hypothetical protein JD844_028597 [Phrynosoma platyrhinos]|uniref:diacylglycerol kinase (ATP) n=1 Tax=Phrynosoma platyrhinos TaxID=52577 RepID=A0ABQ7SIG3_PHRPL|nr:hypothetical protein JD844_028597 [Phrynosoma platyrhinos]